MAENNIQKKRYSYTFDSKSNLRREYRKQIENGNTNRDLILSDKNLSREERAEHLAAWNEAQREAAHIKTEKDNEIGR